MNCKIYIGSLLPLVWTVRFTANSAQLCSYSPSWIIEHRGMQVPSIYGEWHRVEKHPSEKLTSRTKNLTIRASLAPRNTLFLAIFGQGQLKLRWHPITLYFWTRAQRALPCPRKSWLIGRQFSSEANIQWILHKHIINLFDLISCYQTYQ